MENEYFTRKRLSLAQQSYRMQILHPQFASRWGLNSIVWIGSITPTDESRNYTVKVEYRHDDNPIVSVIDPLLRRRFTEEPIPHLYSGDYLCLYRPKYQEWTSYDYIAETIIPWTSLWLYYYEVWHATGEWLGGGEHPLGKRKKAKGSV